MRQSVVAALTCIAIAAGVATSHASPREPIPTSICTVLLRPADWDNKIVSLSASYYDGVISSAVLADDHCDHGVLEAELVWDSAADKELKAALSKDLFGTFGSAVTGTWVGRFHTNYGKSHGTFLEVRAITNLSVSPIDFSASEASPIPTTVEEIVNHPKEFAHKTVVFRSEYISDGMHGSMVFDCGSKGVGSGIRIQRTTGAKGEETLDQALQHGYPGTMDKTIRAEWTGRLAWFPSLASGFYEVQITAIRDLTFSVHPYEEPCGAQPAPAPSHQP
jgi:hypothetical protein